MQGVCGKPSGHELQQKDVPPRIRIRFDNNIGYILNRDNL